MLYRAFAQIPIVEKKMDFFLFFVIVSQCIEIQQRKNAKQYEIEED